MGKPPAISTVFYIPNYIHTARPVNTHNSCLTFSSLVPVTMLLSSLFEVCRSYPPFCMCHDLKSFTVVCRNEIVGKIHFRFHWHSGGTPGDKGSSTGSDTGEYYKVQAAQSDEIEYFLFVVAFKYSSFTSY